MESKTEYEILIYDETDDLSIKHYNNCDIESSDIIKESRGVIYQKADNKEVCRTFSFTPEFLTNDELITSIINEIDFTKIKFYPAKEGSILRLYKVKDKWLLSTHRKIDAFDSKWGDNLYSYGELFIQILSKYYKTDDIFKTFTNKLNPEKVYTFLITTKNRIVCSENKQHMYFVGAFVDGKITTENDTGIESIEELHFDNIEEVKKYVNSVEWKKDQGVILYLPNNKQIKLVNNIYKHYFDLRANEPSLMIRYIQLRKDEESLKEFLKLYEDKEQDFKNFEMKLDKLIDKVHSDYISRFVDKKFFNVDPLEHKILYKCHGYFLNNKRINKITKDKVKDILELMCPKELRTAIMQLI